MCDGGGVCPQIHVVKHQNMTEVYKRHADLYVYMFLPLRSVKLDLMRRMRVVVVPWTLVNNLFVVKVKT